MLPFKHLSVLLFLSFSSCSAQETTPAYTLLGGPCEGCEAIFEYHDHNISNVDTMPGFFENGQKLKVTGTIFQQDGTTPAEDVILYVYHTNPEGIYQPSDDPVGLENKHGYRRTWLKTGPDGRYTYYTTVPGSYPGSTEPAHIHYILLEPNGTYYYLHSCFFDGDPNLTSRQINSNSARGGGNGILHLDRSEDVWTGKRNIILRKNL